jgi:hypothetical protein
MHIRRVDNDLQAVPCGGNCTIGTLAARAERRHPSQPSNIEGGSSSALRRFRRLA